MARETGGESPTTPDPNVLRMRGSAEMLQRINTFGWNTTPLGPIAGWPTSLRTALSILLGSRFPMQLLWGPAYIHFYNDAYLPIAASKHPDALGRPGAQIWPEVWGDVLPMLDQVRTTGEATWSSDLLLVLERHGQLEEGYFTFSYSPIESENGAIDGVFVAVTETSSRVIGARRLQASRDLGRALVGVSHEQAVCEAACTALTRYAADIPFALIYLLDERQQLALACAASLDAAHPAAPLHVSLTDTATPWPLHEALRGQLAVLAEAHGPGSDTLPGGPWDTPARTALVLPIKPAQALQPIGVLVAGVSPRLQLNDEYRSFLSEIAGQIAAALATARAHAATEAAVRIRDDFLSIAAHELKNPLTPIIGRLQLLQRRLTREAASSQHIATVQLVVSEAQRLTAMINALLDVSRLRNGQMSIERAPLDLAALACRLVSELQPTLEAHSLVINSPTQPAMVVGDAMRLEQVVRNLLSNAVKYSPAGGTLTLNLSHTPGHVLLAVTDQGLGIAAEDLPHLFERYYRSDDPHAQSLGGLGVGLFVVHEIVHLHGGTIHVESRLGAGSTFTITLPLASTAR